MNKKNIYLTILIASIVSCIIGLLFSSYKDNSSPEITLIGSNEIVIDEEDEYTEFGYIAIDNVDGDISDRVKISGTVGTEKGLYTLIYTVIDKAGNKAQTIRTVRVVEGLEVQFPIEDYDNVEMPTEFVNEVAYIEFINNGIRVTGVHDETIDSVSIIDSFDIRKYTYNTSKLANGYIADIPLDNLPNGIYHIYLNSGDFTERVVNRLPDLYRVKRTRMGNRLITFEYTNNFVQIRVQTFAYEYDILIDVGHGGRDPGAVNSTHLEKDLNLTVSTYEKKRYEEHGLTVLMTRNGDAVELEMGSPEWRPLSRRVYAMGYYGVVSKIVYSNHHNNYPTRDVMGPEIIVPANLTREQLIPELTIISLWEELTHITEKHNRFYTRDYSTTEILSKAKGEVYNITDYYAVNRVPYDLFNVKAVIFEPAYMSNRDNFKWYWLEEHWIQMSEKKIKTYVEYLGLTYIEPTN